MKLRQAVVEGLAADMAGDLDMQLTEHRAGLAGVLLGHLADDAAGRGNVLVNPQALLGQGEHALLALDQAHAQVFFQTFEGIADAGLAERQLARRAGDAAFLDYHQKGVQQVPVQVAH
ncbi:hypothetical protein D3C86_1437830 [compost metagenome]